MSSTLLRSVVTSGLIALASLAGCKSTGADKVDQTSTRLEQFKNAVGSLKGQLGSTADSLANVVESGNSDPKPAYKEFSKQVDAISSSVTKARTNLEKARTEGAKLFEEWSKRLDTITDPDIRSSSEKRRDDLQKALAGVTDETAPAMADLDAFVTSAKDLQTYLSQDLTPAGIDAISGKSKDLSKSAQSISEDLDDVIEAVAKVSTQFATAKPPPPPPKS
jgi:predicted  nucleic acid-binding Zn-ribbon protein